MDKDIWNDLIILAGFIVGVVIVHFVIFRILKGIFQRSEGFNPKHLNKAKTATLGLLLTFALTAALPLTRFESYINEPVHHFFSLILIFFIAWTLVQGLAIAREVILNMFDITVANNLRARRIYTKIRILERILVFVIVVLALGIALMTFEKIREIGVSLLASAGLAGIILGLAAQKAIATVLAGFQIAITQPIRIDDVVIVEGEWGRIEEINLTYVVVKIWDERRLIVPTTYFIENTFQNWTRQSADILGTIFIYTDYSVNFEKLRQYFTELVKEYDLWDKRVAVMQVTDSTEKAVQIRFLISAINSSAAWDLRVALREKLVSYIQNNFPGALPKYRIESNEDGLEVQPKPA